MLSRSHSNNIPCCFIAPDQEKKYPHKFTNRNSYDEETAFPIGHDDP